MSSKISRRNRQAKAALKQKKEERKVFTIIAITTAVLIVMLFIGYSFILKNEVQGNQNNEFN